MDRKEISSCHKLLSEVTPTQQRSVFLALCNVFLCLWTDFFSQFYHVEINMPIGLRKVDGSQVGGSREGTIAMESSSGFKRSVAGIFPFT